MATTSGSPQNAGDQSDTDELRLEIRSMGFSTQVISQLAAPDLWHLSANYAGAADFINAWSQDNAPGVVISVVDEGVNYRHVDLQGAYDTTLDYDPRDTGDSDAAPDTSAQHHGTNVAGLLIGDINNNVGTVGGAQGSTITGSYLRFGQLFDLSELEQVIAHQKNFDVSNNSWGFTQAFSDNFQSSQFTGTAVALQSVVEQGRGGLGTVMVVAAGNGKIETASGNIGDDSNFHNFSNSRFVIAVGAHDITGAPAFFSSPGTNVLLTAPGVGLLTTDGTDPGSDSSAIVSGTSFAAPLVSSAVALMLAENPDLGYRDVQKILAISATSRVDGHSQENGFGAFNGGGLMFDRDGGFGMLDAGAAVALARNWSQTSTFANEKELDFSFSGAGNLDGNHASMEFNLASPDANGFSTGWVELDLTVTDANLKDLEVDLYSPDGTRSELAENFAQMGNRTYLSFTFSSVAMLGESPFGTWKLEFTHAHSSSNFAVYQADVHVYGDVGSTDETYFYSSSYAALVAADPSRSHAVDSDGGDDTLNFAAGHQPVVLDLSGATASTFQGTPVYLDSAFENAIGTIYNDALTGSAAANRLVGDLGDDVLSGGAGDDTLLGGDGNDVLTGGAGSDTIDGGAGQDTANFEDFWAAYSIAYDASSGTYTLARGSEIDTVKNVEHFVFANVSIDVTSDPGAILLAAAPQIVSVVEADGNEAGHPAIVGVRTASGHGTVVATVTASDANIAAGDNLTFKLVTDTGAAYDGPFQIHKMSATQAAVMVGADGFNLAPGTAFQVFVEVTDLAGHATVQALSIDTLEPNHSPVGASVLAVGIEQGATNAALNLAVPTDPDGDALSFTLTTLASQGTVLLDDHAVALNQVLTAEELQRLTYTAPETGTGTFGLQFAYTDGFNAPEALTVNINVTPAVNGFLVGTFGADRLDGGAGNDIYIVNDAGDTVIERAGGGHDTVSTGVSYALGAGQEIENLETYTTAGTAAINLTGNEFAQTIVGNDGANFINGGGGADTMLGFGGNDVFIIDNAGDTVTERAGGGNDTVSTGVSYALGAGQEIETLETYTTAGMAAINLTGNEFAQTIVGNDGANFINGGGGADTMLGFGGNDIFIVDNAGDHVIEAPGGGNDTVSTGVSYALDAGQEIENLETYTTAGTAAINLTGNEFAQTIVGNDGANFINGGGGADTMLGFGGNDIFIVDNAGDHVIEAPGGGNDTVSTGVSYALDAGQEIENLETYTTSGTAAINLTGNEFNNKIVGNDGANFINGGGGADTMLGFGGNDIFIVDNAGDHVIEAPGGGNDTVSTTVSYALEAGQEIENLETATTSGTAAINLAGNEFANRIVGNNGDNLINGGGGNDTLFGFGGHDTFVFNTAPNAVTNVDTIADFDVVNDTIRLDKGVFTALAHTGALDPGAFFVGAAAHDADDRIVYNDTTGALSYDADGNGAAAAVQFATLTAHLSLTNAHFVVV